jgi:hypothetical protein
VHVLEDEQSGYQSRRQRWLPWPDPTDRTETFGQKLPVNFRRRMAKVDDLIQRWAKQIVLTIVPRLTRGLANSHVNLQDSLWLCDAQKSRIL